MEGSAGMVPIAFARLAPASPPWRRVLLAPRFLLGEGLRDDHGGTVSMVEPVGASSRGQKTAPKPTRLHQKVLDA